MADQYYGMSVSVDLIGRRFGPVLGHGGCKIKKNGSHLGFYVSIGYRLWLD